MLNTLLQTELVSNFLRRGLELSNETVLNVFSRLRYHFTGVKYSPLP